MPRARFTVRALMVAGSLAVLALAWRSVTASHRYAARARAHAGMAAEATFEAEQYRRVGHAAFASRERRRHAHHRALAERYERAARLPWLPVAPDPPEPE